jgi:hypothetical protein
MSRKEDLEAIRYENAHRLNGSFIGTPMRRCSVAANGRKTGPYCLTVNRLNKETLDRLIDVVREFLEATSRKG